MNQVNIDNTYLKVAHYMQTGGSKQSTINKIAKTSITGTKTKIGKDAATKIYSQYESTVKHWKPN